MSTSASGPSPPFFEVTPTDHRAWIAVGTTLGLCCTLVTLMIRGFVRVAISPPFGRDDIFMLVATVGYYRPSLYAGFH